MMKNNKLQLNIQFFAAPVSGAGTVWNLPNYAGDLFTAAPTETPFLSMIGGLSGGQQTDNFEFSTYSDYDLPNAKQPAISEDASKVAPTATAVVRGQATNVTQIFHESVEITYAKMANGGRLSGLNTAGAQNNVSTEKDWQIAKKLQIIARDVEHTFLNGTYQKATGSNEANKTRGMFELCKTGTTITATGSPLLTEVMIKELLLEMFKNGAKFINPVMFVNGLNKQVISEIYQSFAPASRNVGGMNIQTITTDFGDIGIVVDKFIPADSLGVFDMSCIAPVFQPVPGKGNFFYEELAKVGAVEKGQIFGMAGLAHGHASQHGTITGLKTTRA